MNKKKLVSKVALKSGLTIETANKVVDAVFESINESLHTNEVVQIRGFGRFSVAHYVERNGVNPSTRQPMVIPARKAVKFVASKSVEIKDPIQNQ